MADDRIVLDPSVELAQATALEALADGPGGTTQHGAEIAVIDLYNHWLGTAMVAPARRVIGELLEALAEPVALAELRDAFDPRDVDRVVGELAAHGFVHAAGDLAAQRDAWLGAHRSSYRQTVDADLDAGWPALAAGVDARLRCRRADDHLDRLAGDLDVRSLAIAVGELPGPQIRDVLLARGATLELRGGWPVPDLAVPEGLLATRVELAVPWRELTPEHARRCIAWANAARISGLRLRPHGTGAAVDAADAAIRLLEDALGDVDVVGLPGDDVIVGHRLDPPGGDVEPALLRRHLRRRVASIRELENLMGPPPSSEGDATLIDPADDVVPSEPALLGLRPGATVVDVGCSAGRTSRRLSAAVAPGGRILGIDREQLLIELGRDVDRREGYTAIQARRGLAQRLPFPDAAVDAVVCDWSFNMFLGAGIADAALHEMARVLRPGGRVAVMQVLSRFELADPAQAFVYGRGDLAAEIDACFARCGGLRVVARKLWAAEERSAGRPTRWYWPAHLPRLVDPVEHAVFAPGRRAMLCYSVIAERHGLASTATMRSSDV